MADGEVRAQDLAQETASTLSGNEQFVMFDSTAGKRADIDDVATYVAGDKTTLKTTNKTSPVAAINENFDAIADVKEDLSLTESSLIRDGILKKICNDVYINSGQNKWASLTGYRTLLLGVSKDDSVFIKAGSQNTFYAWLQDDQISVGSVPNYATGTTAVTQLISPNSVTITAPETAKYLYVALGTSDTDRTPATLTLNGYNELISVVQHIKTAEDLLAIVSQNNSNILSIIKTKNYFGRKYIDISTLNSGYINHSNGNVQPSDSYVHTDYIDVSNVRKIGVSRGNAQFAFYDIAYNYVDGVSIVSTQHDFAQYTVPANAYYCRLSISISSGNKAYYTLSKENEFPFEDYVVIDNSGVFTNYFPDFTTLRSGVLFARNFNASKVFVKQGTYNLLTEFATEISTAGASQYGIGLDNDVHVLFSSGAVVTALYTGSVQNVTTYFAPFYSEVNGGGFTLENLTIKASNTRYCVHDEMGSSTVPSRVVKYINCNMIFDNTTAPTQNYPQCIGGGNSRHDYIEIRGCYFKSKRAETQSTPLVSYHNDGDSGYSLMVSNVNISDCYFADTYGMFKCLSYGASTLMSKAYLHNNSFGQAPVMEHVGGSSGPDNYQIVEWLNEIRA